MSQRQKQRESNKKSYYKHREKRLANQRSKRKLGLLKNYYKLNPDKYKNRMLYINFGITGEEYNNLLSAQNSLCAICNKPEKVKRLAVDHNHESLKIRGLLCQKCNRGLGMFNDSKDLLAKAIHYLIKNN